MDGDAPKEVINQMDTVALVIDSVFHCDSLSIQTPIGTACCISGPTKVKPGDIAIYQYQMNHQDPSAEWVILEGDISILSGQDTRTVTVQFGPDFRGGTIQCFGFGYKDGDKLICNDRILINHN